MKPLVACGLAALASLSNLAWTQTSSASDADLLAIGQRIYREGVLPSGEPLRGVGEANVTLAGEQAACATCHRRSGYGSSEGPIEVRAITGPALFGERVAPTAPGSAATPAGLDRRDRPVARGSRSRTGDARCATSGRPSSRHPPAACLRRCVAGARAARGHRRHRTPDERVDAALRARAGRARSADRLPEDAVDPGLAGRHRRHGSLRDRDPARHRPGAAARGARRAADLHAGPQPRTARTGAARTGGPKRAAVATIGTGCCTCGT